MTSGHRLGGYTITAIAFVASVLMYLQHPGAALPVS